MEQLDGEILMMNLQKKHKKLHDKKAIVIFEIKE